jgi:diguanylate cyclase (GGDEF)-like protein/PAS domain S-box-containing protein
MRQSHQPSMHTHDRPTTAGSRGTRMAVRSCRSRAVPVSLGCASGILIPADVHADTLDGTVDSIDLAGREPLLAAPAELGSAATTLSPPKAIRTTRTRITTLLTADRGGILILCGSAVVLLVLAGAAAVGLIETTRTRLGYAAILPSALLAAAVGFRAFRERRLAPKVRKAWLFVAAAHFSYAIGIAFGGYRLPLADDPPGIMAGAFLLLFYPLLLIGLLAFPTERRRRVFWLDTATALLAGATIFWYVVPPLWSSTAGTAFGRALATAAAVGDYLLVLGLAAILFRRSLPTLLPGLQLLAAAVAVFWVGQIGDAILQSGGTTEAELGYLWIHVVQGLLVAASAQTMIVRSRLRRSSAPVAAVRAARRFAFPIASFSYVGIALGYAIMLHAASRAAPSDLRTMVAVGGVLVALMVLRQSVVIRDSERARETIRASEERFRALVQHASDVVTVVDADGIVRYQGASAERVLGRAPLPPGTPLVGELHPDDEHVLTATLQEALRSGGTPVRGEWRSRHASGTWLHLETVATNLIGDGIIDGIVLNSSDLTERKALEEELTHRAFHDPLTGLANRALFSNILDLALIRARRSGKGTAVLFLDLDSFKTVNDLLGHGAGDSLLVEVAVRLRREVRVSDTVSRQGGDEFAVLLDDMSHADDALVVAGRILSALRIEVPTGGEGAISVTASIGLAIATGVESREEMLRMADSAMYEAKRAGGDRLLEFAELMGKAHGADRLGEADLRRALELGEFAVRYQPIQSVLDGRMTAVAAESRWFHPRQGLLPPEEFMPLAEVTGHDLALGYHIMEEACRQVGTWQRRYAGAARLGLNLRLTGRQLQDPALGEQVRGILSRTGMTPGTLALEITEGDLLDLRQHLLRRMHPLRELGVKIAVAEFGAGCRVLNTLSGFPLDVLRLDSSLIGDLRKGDHLAASAVVNLGRSLNLQTLADGVDGPEQLEALRELGCEFVQGQHVGGPVSRDRLESLLRSADSETYPAAF